MFLLPCILVSGLFVFLPIQGSSTEDKNMICEETKYNYTEVIRISLLFYEAQRSGDLTPANRIPWRADSSLLDKGDDGEDLVGGYHDAGDYVKFGFPLASALTVLSWGGLTFMSGYQEAGQLGYLADAVKWGTDYIIKAHVEDNVFYCQVGSGEIDHDYPGRPEDMNITRPAFKLTPEKPGSDCAGESAAALAAASLLLKPRYPEYAAHLIKHAQQLFRFANTYRGLYSDSIEDAKQFYRSESYSDELQWASAWLFKATNNTLYLDTVNKLIQEFPLNPNCSEFSWADKQVGAQLLLYTLTKDMQYGTAVEKFCNNAIHNLPRSPKGQVHLYEWGSNRYAANFAFICIQAYSAGLGNEDFLDFAKEQIGYILGDGGRSFVVGFGDNYPTRPHHKASACPSPPTACTWETFSAGGPNPHLLLGALVGGPRKADDDYEDDRTDYISNEVSLDYNAGFQGAVVGLFQIVCGL